MAARISFSLVFSLTFLLALVSRADVTLVREGEAVSVIVIADDAHATTKLAAEELQTYLAKMSGATVPITTTRDPYKTAIYVGESEATRELGLTVDELTDGAFRIAAGEDWLALLGRDTTFVPPKPYNSSNSDIERMLEEWDKVSGGTWGSPIVQVYKRFNRELGIWNCSERSSFNAVCEFLRRQGVRWYYPGEMGEVVPQKATITVTPGNETVRPAFAMRNWHVAHFHVAPQEHILWTLRQGLNHGENVRGFGPIGHGTRVVHARKEMQEAHPEYYGLFGDQRDTFYGGAGRPCLSSAGLLQENINYARAVFDVYDMPMVSVMPQDGYGNVCQCELCEGKGTPERGWFGGMSDYVFQFTEKVASEVYKTHPDHKISSFAYGTYLLPPETIDRFSPNVVLGIVQSRAYRTDPERKQKLQDVRGRLLEQSENKLMIWDHYLHSREKSAFHGLPVYYPHAIADDLRELEGKSYGDFIEVSFGRGLAIHAPIFNHLNLWVTARLYWDPQADLDTMLAEYYEQMWGPAAAEMKELVDYSEANFVKMPKDPELLGEAIKRLDALLAAAPADTPYAQRAAELSDYLKPMRELRERLLHGRDDAMEVRALNRPPRFELTFDGNLDDPFWANLPSYPFRNIETGELPPHTGSTQLAWRDGMLHFAIRCNDLDMDTLTDAAKEFDDTNIWNGDCIELLIETQSHSYYQIVISPDGNVTDLDRQNGISMGWTSDIEVRTQRHNDGWTIEARLPVAPPEQTDPNNLVLGRLPTQTHPWYINVCRQRKRGQDRQWTAISPTATGHFHVPLKFAKLYSR